MTASKTRLIIFEWDTGAEAAASQIVLPVVSIDGRMIGDGKPGPVAAALRREFHRYAEAG